MRKARRRVLGPVRCVREDGALTAYLDSADAALLGGLGTRLTGDTQATPGLCALVAGA
jgi:hypothetical protein